MIDYQQYFNWPDVHLHHFYIYFVVAAIIAFMFTYKSESKYKIELFFISFFLLTGNINNVLTLKIPGFSLFEIQPDRFIFLLLSFFIFRKSLLSREKLHFTWDKNIPWFEVALFAYVILLIASVLYNSSDIGLGDVLKRILDALAFLVLIVSLRMMRDRPSYDLIGKSIMIGAAVSSVVSLIQLFINPYFLRIGDARVAFGGMLRSNGIFNTEYFNSYYLIIAIVWTLITIKRNTLKLSMVALFSLGVLSSFQRMSWLILGVVLITYFVYIKKSTIERLLLTGLSCLALILSISIFFYQDIKNSTLVKDRLTDSVDGRKGYYSMVLDNIGDRPLFGYGGLNNEVYYVNLLRITGNRDRATGKEGDLHSGYFSALFLYGIPAFICFVLFVAMSVFYYSRSFQNDLYFVIPFFVSIIYMIGNLSNTFLFLKYISILYAIHIGIGMGINKIKQKSVPEY